MRANSTKHWLREHERATLPHHLAWLDSKREPLNHDTQIDVKCVRLNWVSFNSHVSVTQLDTSRLRLTTEYSKGEPFGT